MACEVIKFPDLSPASLVPGEGFFEMKIGGTNYEVSTHFCPEGKQSVLEQFMTLVLSNHLV